MGEAKMRLEIDSQKWNHNSALRASLDDITAFFRQELASQKNDHSSAMHTALTDLELSFKGEMQRSSQELLENNSKQHTGLRKRMDALESVFASEITDVRRFRQVIEAHQYQYIPSAKTASVG